MRRHLAVLLALAALVLTAGVAAAPTLVTATAESITVTFDGYSCGETHTFTDDAGRAVTGSTEACPLPSLVDSNIQDGATISAGQLWTVSPNQSVDSVEFWANGARLSTDTSAPYEQVLNLPIGASRIGVATNNGSTRLVWGLNGRCSTAVSGCVTGTFANVTVPAPPPHPPAEMRRRAPALRASAG